MGSAASSAAFLSDTAFQVVPQSFGSELSMAVPLLSAPVTLRNIEANSASVVGSPLRTHSFTPKLVNAFAIVVICFLLC